MTLAQVYAIAATRGIEIDDHPMRLLRAVSFPQGWIAIDLRKFSSDTDVKCVLAHEIGHIVTGRFYNIHTTKSVRALHERHANRFAAELLVPLRELLKVFHQGFSFNRLLARMFDVTLEFIDMVLELFEQELLSAARMRIEARRISASVTDRYISSYGLASTANGP